MVRWLPPSFLGVLPPSSCIHPWCHDPTLKALVRELHSGPASQDDGGLDGWALTQPFFKSQRAYHTDMGSVHCIVTYIIAE